MSFKASDNIFLKWHKFMPRRPRNFILAPYSLYHIVSRGNNQRRIFRSDRDFKKFLKILEETKRKYPFFLYSYNLLPNHYHLSIETKEIPISKIMHQVNTSFVKYFRRRYGGSGHLFQERFFASLVDKEPYLWEMSRYIDLNAVQAGLVERPEAWRWGSYAFYTQKESQETLLDKERFLRYGGDDLEESRLFYLNSVEEGLKLKKEPPFPINKKMI